MSSQTVTKNTTNQSSGGKTKKKVNYVEVECSYVMQSEGSITVLVLGQHGDPETVCIPNDVLLSTGDINALEPSFILEIDKDWLNEYHAEYGIEIKAFGEH